MGVSWLVLPRPSQGRLQGPGSSPCHCIGRAVGSIHGLPILSMSCALTAGDKLDAENQVYRRKLHSFYDVQEEIGRYRFLTRSTVFQSFPGHSQHGTYCGSPLSFFTPGVCLGL
jgi:hypothetical protein